LGVQDLAAGPVQITGRKAEAKAVALKAGQDVQVDVKDVLSRRLAVGKKKVDPSQRSADRRMAAASFIPTRNR